MVLPRMLERARAHVVNMASLAGKVPTPYVHTAATFPGAAQRLVRRSGGLDSARQFAEAERRA